MEGDVQGGPQAGGTRVVFVGVGATSGPGLPEASAAHARKDSSFCLPISS